MDALASSEQILLYKCLKQSALIVGSRVSKSRREFQTVGSLKARRPHKCWAIGRPLSMSQLSSFMGHGKLSFIRPHRLDAVHIMRPIATDINISSATPTALIALSVLQCVCVSVCWTHWWGCAKTDEPIEVPFRADSCGSKEPCIRR